MSEWADGPERSLGVRKHAFKIKMFVAIEMQFVRVEGNRLGFSNLILISLITLVT